MDFGTEHDERRDWSAMIPDMLHRVSENIPDIYDFIHFQVVCKPWRSASLVIDSPSFFPWLLSRSSCSSNKLCFYSLLSEKIHTIHANEYHRKELIGPVQSFIFSTDSKHSSPIFLNPITKKHVSLPPLHLDWCFPISNSTECVAICGGKNDSEYQTLGFCRPGDDKWMEIQKSLAGCLMIYYEGMYVVYDPTNGDTKVIDVTTGDILSVIPAPPTKLNYLVESSGELLGISCAPEHNGCEIYRLDQVNESSSWENMSGVGDRILFLQGGQGFSIRAHKSYRFEGNCIYHLGHNEAVNIHGTCTTYHLFRYKIGERSWEKLSLPFIEEPTWFLPSLQ